MTHPITPREKVAQIIKEKVSGPHFVAMEQDRFIAADAILTTLASGSGDHAELARLAEAAEHDPEYDGRSFEAAANPTTVLALLAENAALRAACDGMVEEVSRSQARLHAATEAERKLAEAVGLLRPFSEAAESLDDETRDHDHIWEQPAAMSIDAGHLRAARNFLSKEAERG